MFLKYWRYTDCINCDDLASIGAALTDILQPEGFSRIDQLPEDIPVDELRALPRNLHRRLVRNFLIIGLYPGAAGWTIMKTRPQEFMCRRGNNSSQLRLSKMAMGLGCQAFHWGVYDNYCAILLEADSTGRVFVSGYHWLLEKEGNVFYQEPINYTQAWKFHLIDIPEEIQEAIRPDTREEWQEKEKKLKELDTLFKQGIDTQMEQSELLVGNGTRADQVLKKFIGADSLYWSNGGDYHTIYTQKEQIIADGGKLLYFQTPEYYQHLKSLSGLIAKY